MHSLLGRNPVCRRMSSVHHKRRTLALAPTNSGFAYACFEGMQGLVDWGLVNQRMQSTSCFRRRLTPLLDRYQPECLVVEELAGSRRGKRGRAKILAAEGLAHEFGLQLTAIGTVELVGAFGRTKWDRAVVLAECFPELRPRMPRKRKAWMSQDDRMAIFDAASFGLVALWRGHDDVRGLLG